MRVLKKRFLYSLIGAILCAVAAVYFACVSKWYAAALLAVGTVVLAVFLFHFSRSYQAARLITDNPILSVGVASVAQAGEREAAEASVNVVVSGFGILMDGRPYKFGHGGMKLTSAEIDRESIALDFGCGEKRYSVRLLHGLAGKQEAEKLQTRLFHETGVNADIVGW